jgi:hypothetical protein
MAYATIRACDLGLVRGRFKNELGNWFEYSAAESGEASPFPGYGLKVYVGGAGAGGDHGFRWARVLATVAYVVVDEAADGGPVVEKWAVKSHAVYK